MRRISKSPFATFFLQTDKLTSTKNDVDKNMPPNISSACFLQIFFGCFDIFSKLTYLDLTLYPTPPRNHVRGDSSLVVARKLI